jgi:arabinose-5-phosphate isomerase
MLRRGFELDDYAETHPAGQLGRNLILKVEDVLHKPQKVACLSKSATMKETIIEMSKQPLGAACIVENRKLLGIVTDGDLRRALNENDNLLKLSVSEVMSTDPLFVDPKSTLGQALELMEKRSPSPVSVLPVIEQNTQNFLGILRLHDIYKG